MGLILLVLILVLLFGGFGLHAGYYGPVHFGGGVGLVLIILLVLILAGYL